MKNKLLFALVGLLCGVQVMATDLVVERTTGADILQDIALIGKLVFLGNDIQLLDKAGNVLATEAIADIRKIVFAESTTTALDDVEEENIVVYPNPTKDMLYINGINNKTIRVYDLQGRILLQNNGSEVSENSAAIRVGNLPVGTYLLQIGTQVVRFIKN